MSETNTRQFYPNANLEGTPIPYEVLYRPGLINVAVSGTVSGSVSLTAAMELLVLYCDVDCYIKFDGTAAAPANETPVADLLFLPAYTHMAVDHSGASAFTAIRAGADDGTLRVQYTKRWKETRPVQNFTNT